MILLAIKTVFFRLKTESGNIMEQKIKFIFDKQKFPVKFGSKEEIFTRHLC